MKYFNHEFGSQVIKELIFLGSQVKVKVMMALIEKYMKLSTERVQNNISRNV